MIEVEVLVTVSLHAEPSHVDAAIDDVLTQIQCIMSPYVEDIMVETVEIRQ